MTVKPRYKAVEFWIAVLGALVAIGVLSVDVPVDEWAATIVGALGIVAALLGRTRE